MHYFSKDETLPEKWIRFVRISLERFPSCEKAGFMLCIFFFICGGVRILLKNELGVSLSGLSVDSRCNNYKTS